MNAVAPAVCLVVAAAVCAQDAGPLEAVTSAYRTGAVADRMEIEVPRENAPPARSEMTVAVRTGQSPAVSLHMGGANPLRVLAEPGRLIAWRAGDRSRVFVAPLGEPFGREAIEAVIPPLLAPQIDLAFAPEPGPMLAFMPELAWSLVARGVRDRYAGVSAGASLELRVDNAGRLASMEARLGGRVIARAAIETVEAEPRWFEAPSLDVEVVASLAELGEPPGPVEPGGRFGDAIGTDARGRVATLRSVATDGLEEPAGRVVVLAVEVRLAEDRARVAGALAEAPLGEIARLLDARIVVLAIGDAPSAGLLERVTRAPRGQAGRVRAIAVEPAPAWLPEMRRPVAYAVDGDAWMLLAAHPVAPADEADGPASWPPDPVPAGPLPSSWAPRSLAERLAEAVGAAARE
ncbi:MAG: hypothetical protein ACIAS6_12080 [Phycisphaerales bacterium JB060]